MTYLKTLIALTTLALLTACAGGVTINNNDNSTTLVTVAICTANPFTKGCNATPTQQEAFCRDTTRTPDDKTTNCELTVARLCGENPFQTGFCTTPTEQEAEAFCSDATKTTATKANDCIPTVSRVCGENPFEAGLCLADNTYAIERLQIRATCTSRDGNVRNDLCPTIVATACMGNPFLPECLVGDAGASDGAYGQARTAQITANCAGADGTGFGNVFHRACNGIALYVNQRNAILNACASGTENNPNCPAGTIVQICNANPYNMDLCLDDTDYDDKRAEELTECRTDNGRSSCVDAAATTCTDNPFQAVLCFIDEMTYASDRLRQLQNCNTNPDTAPNCADAIIYVCNDRPFDGFCKGATEYIDTQLNRCALGDATTLQCNAVFDDALAGCLLDPFSVACDTEATFMDSKASVRTKRFGFCTMTENASDGRCAGYRTCNTSTTFAPATCGADFNPVRMTFCAGADNAFDTGCVGNLADRMAQTEYCKVTAQAFDAGCVAGLADAAAQTAFCKVTAQAFDTGCVGNLINAEAQLAYCKLDTSDPFGTDCGGTAFREAREEFCMAKSSTIACDTDLHNEDLMYVHDPCANGACVVETADWLGSFTANGGTALPTTPDATTRKNEFLAATATGFADGATNGIMNTGITPSAVEIVTVKFASTDTATGGAAMFGGGVYAANGSRVGTGTFHYAGILAGTDLGAPIAETITTAVTWRGQIRAVGTDLFAQLDAGEVTDFELTITFDGTEGELKTIFEAPGSGGNYYSIDGTFDVNGIISGSVDYGRTTGTGDSRVVNTTNPSYSPGTLRGIIGASGAVGVFHSNNGNTGEDQTSFAGGFIALPPDPCIALGTCVVNTAAWVESFTANGGTAPLTAPATTNTPPHGFLRGGVATVDFGTLRAASNTDPTVRPLNLQDATYNNVPLGGDVEDGVAFFETYNGTESGGYAGIFSGTDLGAPLSAYVADTEAIVVWYGKFWVEGSADIRNKDFTLNVNLETRKIDAFVRFAGTSHYKLDGDFNDKGVIVNGTVTYGAFTGNNKNTLAETIKAGILTGLIGQEGAVGVLHADDDASGSETYVGGFVAAPADPCIALDTCPANTATWLRSFAVDKVPPAMPNLITRANQFLRGTETTLLTTGTQDSGSNTAAPTVTTVTLADNDLGGVAADGFAFFDGHIAAANKQYYYAGILSGTDLGAPLTQQPISTLWRGHIRLRGFTTLNKSFTLTVNYGVGSQVGGGTLSAFVRLGSAGTTLFYKIDAEFNAKGLIITGDATNPNIVYDEFTGANPDMPTMSGDRHTGILSGIIGEQGVVAAFISNPHAVDSYVFSGGFVAEPVAPADDFPNKVTFNDWVRLSDYRLFGSAASADAGSTAPSHFIRPKADGTLDLTDVTLVTPYTVRRAGDVNDGFVYTAGTISERTQNFVGILPSTDLGAPLTEAIVTATWPGQFSFGNTATLHDIEFTLTFDGTDSGTIDGMGGTTIKFDLDFDGKGIITGNVISTALGFGGTAPARGLIGEEGLVGVYANINGSELASNLFGGFVAAPPDPCIALGTCVVNTAAWVESFGEGKAPPAMLDSSVTATERQRQFLTGLATVTNGKGLDETGAVSILANRALTLDSARYNGEPLGGAGDEKDGYGLFFDTVAPNNQVYYAGLLSDTDLGAPLTEPSGSVTWYGQIQIFRGSSLDTTPAHDFTLEITFGAKVGVDGSVGSIEGFVENNDGLLTTQYRVAGTYDAGGVITGTTTRAGFSGPDTGQLDAATPDGILTGLIGEQGAVGVFLSAEAGSTKDNIIDSGGGLPYVGGFVAAPPPDVDYAVWLASFEGGNALTTTPATPAKNQFLAITATTASSLTAVVPTTLFITGSTTNGVAFFTENSSYYAGVLEGTNLGSVLPLTARPSVTWNAFIHSRAFPTPTAFPLTVGFTGAGGTLDGLIQFANGTSLAYDINGTFDAKGVIGGDVVRGRYSSTVVGCTATMGVNPNTLKDCFDENNVENATLTLSGIIGVEGAVAVFQGQDADTITYYGGFVASPTP